MNVPIFGVRKKMSIFDGKDYLTKEETERDFLKKEDAKEQYISKNTFDKKTKEIEATLETKITKEDLPKTYTRQEVKDRYVKKDSHQKDLEKKMDKVLLPDFESFAKKSDLEGLIAKDCVDLRPYAKKEDLNQYAKKDEVKGTEISYCMVKLLSDFKIYDGNDWAFEFYMGNRGNWKILKDTHNMIQKPQEYNYITAFKGVFYIDFCFTCRKDTHILKPRALQRIRSSEGEFINWQYHNIHPETVTKPNVSVLTFRNRAELLLEKGAWIKCSMEFDNRLHNHKKDWLHAVGSDGGYTPTYFSITGHKVE